MRLMLRTRLTCLCWLGLQASAAAADLGIVMLHGKWDRPPTHVAALAQQLQADGHLVAQPVMPWSALREYDVPYPQALREIEAAAQQLRDQGAKRIVVGGLSFGANAAIAYAASGRPVAAIFALSPGHAPDRGPFRKAVADSVAKAQAMITAGQGQTPASFDDVNQGRSKQVRVTANAYWSYFDPEGLAAMGPQAAAIAPGLPIFMAVGTEDKVSTYAEDGIFKRAPAHSQSLYLSVATDHNGVVTVAAEALRAWLRALKP